MSTPQPQPKAKPALLIVDDDPLITDTLAFALGTEYTVYACDSRPHAIELLHAHKIPFVVVMRVDVESKDSVSYVVDDDLRGGYLATKHLLDLGHRRIGYVSRTATPAALIAATSSSASGGA